MGIRLSALAVIAEAHNGKRRQTYADLLPKKERKKEQWDY
jgi:hypothetical protein